MNNNNVDIYNNQPNGYPIQNQNDQPNQTPMPMPMPMPMPQYNIQNNELGSPSTPSSQPPNYDDISNDVVIIENKRPVHPGNINQNNCVINVDDTNSYTM